MSWFLVALQKYAVFKGRSRRKEFWYFTLFSYIIIILLMLVDAFIGTLDDLSGFGLLSGIAMVGSIIPYFAVSSRRLHDTGRTAWWILISLIPLIGWIVLIVFWAQKGVEEDNAYGPNPMT